MSTAPVHKWSLVQTGAVYVFIALVLAILIFYLVKIGQHRRQLLAAIKSFSCCARSAEFYSEHSRAEYSNIPDISRPRGGDRFQELDRFQEVDNSLDKGIPEACQSTLIMEVLILQMIPWCGFLVRVGASFCPVHHALIGLLFVPICLLFLCRSYSSSKSIKEHLAEAQTREQHKGSKRRSMMGSGDEPPEPEETALSKSVWMIVSLLVWSIGAMYGLALADAFLYDTDDDPLLQKQYVKSWSGAPHEVMAVVNTLHIKYFMLLSLCFGTIVNVGMALSNIRDKPMITAQLASLDNLIVPLYLMKDPLTGLSHDSDRLLAVGMCRVFYEWVPRVWLQESLIMAHCSNIWELPFCLICIIFSLVGIGFEVYFSSSLRGKTVKDNSGQDQGLPAMRKTLLLVVAALSALAAVAVMARLVAAEICKGPWQWETGCIPCLQDVHHIVKVGH